MGITSEGLRLLEWMLARNGMDFSRLSMCELGNQWMFLDPVEGVPYRSSAKPFFQSLGVTHVSLDKNGKDGAISVDLGKVYGTSTGAPIGVFDVVTDFGTAEHVDDFATCLINIHNLCRVGGVMLHSLPHTGHWPGHGKHYIEVTTILELASVFGYEVQRVETAFALGNTKDGKLVRAVLKKTLDSKVDKRQLEGIPRYED
jgi:hypothetical protein